MNPILLAFQETDPFSLVGRLLESPITKTVFGLFALVAALLYLSLVWWVFSDASRRGALRMPWTLAALLLPYVGALVYVLCRPPEYVLDARERELEMMALELVLTEGTRRCARCDATVRSDYLGCPRCGLRLKRECGGCGRPLEDDWEVCPYCMTGRSRAGGSVSEERAAGSTKAERGGREAQKNGRVPQRASGHGRPGKHGTSEPTGE